MLRRKASADDRLGQLSANACVLFLLAIPWLDIEGRMDGFPAAVRGTVAACRVRHHPDQWTDRHVEDYMGEWTRTVDLDSHPDPLVLWYCVKGVWACEFVGFKKNQKLRVDREAPSRFPAPPEDLLSTVRPRAVAAEDADPHGDADPHEVGLDADPAPQAERLFVTPAQTPPELEGDTTLFRMRLANRARQMAKRARDQGAHVEPVDLFEIGEAYDWTCHLCRKPILRLYGKETDCLSFDHIVALERGGAHVPDNLAPAHFGCNASKCNRETSRYSGSEAEAEVQVQEPPEQRGLSRPRAREGASLAALPDHESGKDPLASIVAGVAKRRDALRTHGPLSRLLEMLHDADESTPAVLHALFDPLGPAAIEHARQEILAYGPRQPSRYAVGIAKKLARQGTAA